MTSRERLFAALEGRPVDRVPVWLLFPYRSPGCYADVRANPRYRSVFEASRERAIMLDRRGRRFILSPSAGPYEEAVDTNVIRNYHTFLDAGWEYGRS
jgi:hypothetical protein